MSEPREAPPNVPPDWRDWIDKFPTMKSLAILCFVAWIITPQTLSVVGWLISNGYIKGEEEIDGVIGLVDRWLDALNWLTAAAVFGVVSKFATTKPDVIRAEGEVKAKAVVAATQAAAIAPTSAATASGPVLTQADAQLAAQVLEAAPKQPSD